MANWFNDMAPRLQEAGMILAGQGPSYMLAKAKEEETRALNDKRRQKAMLEDGRKAYILGKMGKWGEAQSLMQDRLDKVVQLGGNPSGTADMLRMMQEGRHEDALRELETVDAIAVATGQLSPIGGETAYQKGAQITVKDEQGNVFLANSRFNPATGESDPILTPLGDAQKPVGRIQVVGSYGETRGEKIERSGLEAGAKEEAKSEAELKWGPKIAAAREDAVLTVRNAQERGEEQKDNAKILSAYDTAMNNLATALGSTETGPVKGWLNTLSSDAQIADGAVATMAPMLKQMFRSAGEGTFTDNDQKLLMDMVPTRKDHPESVKAKIEMIDAVVRAKLGASSADTGRSGQRPPGWRMMRDANGNQAWVGPNGEIEEI